MDKTRNNLRFAFLASFNLVSQISVCKVNPPAFLMHALNEYTQLSSGRAVSNSSSGTMCGRWPDSYRCSYILEHCNGNTQDNISRYIPSLLFVLTCSELILAQSISSPRLKTPLLPFVCLLAGSLTLKTEAIN